jgi:hypothetical protein
VLQTDVKAQGWNITTDHDEKDASDRENCPFCDVTVKFGM